MHISARRVNTRLAMYIGRITRVLGGVSGRRPVMHISGRRVNSRLAMYIGRIMSCRGLVLARVEGPIEGLDAAGAHHPET